MSNFFDDLTSLSNNGFTLQNIANTTIGKSLAESATASITKKLTPKPAPAPAPAIIQTQEVGVSSAPVSNMKKIMMYVGGGMGILVLIYMLKKGRK